MRKNTVSECVWHRTPNVRNECVKKKKRGCRTGCEVLHLSNSFDPVTVTNPRMRCVACRPSPQPQSRSKITRSRTKLLRNDRSVAVSHSGVEWSRSRHFETKYTQNASYKKGIVMLVILFFFRLDKSEREISKSQRSGSMFDQARKIDCAEFDHIRMAGQS